MNDDCLFCKILKNEIPSERVYEDGEILAFKDIKPMAPVHILVISKKHIESLDYFKDKYEKEPVKEDLELAGRLLAVCARIAESYHLKDGYRVITNIGEHGGQTVKHLHFHILGGKMLSTELA